MSYLWPTEAFTHGWKGHFKFPVGLQDLFSYVWLEWLGWMSGDGSVTGAGKISQLCIPDLSEIQLLSHKLHSCAKSLQVAWADIMLHLTGWALRDDQQRNIWADMEPQNIWKLTTDIAKEITLLLCDLQLNTPAIKWTGFHQKKKKKKNIWFRFEQLISSLLQFENYVLN